MEKTPGQEMSKDGRRHIDSLKPSEIHGIFDDEGYEVNRNMIPKPPRCLICKKDFNPEEELLCNMNRFDQRGSKEFKCYAFDKMDPLPIRKI